ncbi:MAG TPA: T9SS type A sorting domain-containing protein [Flavobacteriales bacterium]|nr:T9SS type A sorting domain-containing protein [Flavobacteriales bacterium]HIB76767.1 T9SS type A sorting domain-containing protein [Flavobacteriales bacterium]
MIQSIRIFFTAVGILAATFVSAQTVTHTIAEVQGELFASPLIEQIVTVQGIVTAANDFSYFIQNGSGAWNGIYIYDNTNLPTVGDDVILEGEVSEYYDLTEISNITYFETVSSGNELPAVVIVESGVLGASGEPYEGCLVQIVNAVCTNPDADFGQGYFNDSSGDCMVDDMLYMPDPAWVIDEYYSITGVLTYSYDEYKIEPRDASDVSIGMAVGTIELISVNLYPNPTVDAINFTLNTAAIASVYDVNGRLVFSENVNAGNNTLEVSGLRAGSYRVDCVSDLSISRASFVKK